MENPKTIAAAVIHETNELRISVPIRAQGKGAVSLSRGVPLRQVYLPCLLVFLCLAAACRDHSPLSITRSQLG
jgi:hypothetical protein